MWRVERMRQSYSENWGLSDWKHNGYWRVDWLFRFINNANGEVEYLLDRKLFDLRCRRMSRSMAVNWTVPSTGHNLWWWRALSLYYITYFVQCFHDLLKPYKDASSTICTFSNCLGQTRSRAWFVTSELEAQSSKHQLYSIPTVFNTIYIVW